MARLLVGATVRYPLASKNVSLQVTFPEVFLSPEGHVLNVHLDLMWMSFAAFEDHRRPSSSRDTTFARGHVLPLVPLSPSSSPPLIPSLELDTPSLAFLVGRQGLSGRGERVGGQSSACGRGVGRRVV